MCVLRGYSRLLPSPVCTCSGLKEKLLRVKWARLLPGRLLSFLSRVLSSTLRTSDSKVVLMMFKMPRIVAARAKPYSTVTEINSGTLSPITRHYACRRTQASVHNQITHTLTTNILILYSRAPMSHMT